jgi:hypothetical protein
MRLETPDKIRTLQRKLYCKAKAKSAFRFYLLYDKICREDIRRPEKRRLIRTPNSPPVSTFMSSMQSGGHAI